MELPTLEGLDKKDSGKYVRTLEEGITTLEEMFDEIAKEVREISDNYRNEMRKKLAGIPGVERILETDTPKPKTGLTDVRMEIEGVTLEAALQAPAVIGEVERRYWENCSKYKELVERIRNRLFNFKKALIELTQVDALTDVREDPDRLTLYVALGADMYELHLDLETFDLSRRPSQLTSQELYDPDFEEECKRDDTNGDIYRVFNPSGKMLFSYAALYGLKQIGKETKRKYGIISDRFLKGMKIVQKELTED